VTGGFFVIPAKTGIRCFIMETKDSCFCRNNRQPEKLHGVKVGYFYASILFLPH
jgi:hypothetical protein